MSINQVSDDFGYWLSGFIDGEGCFSIFRPSPRKTHYGFGLRLWVRADDADIIREIHRRTSVGSVIFRKLRNQRQDGYTQQAQIGWDVTKKADCLAVVQLLTRYPLRAKKRRDFAIWREAVLIWAQLRRRGPHRSDWGNIAELADALASVRAFGGGSSSGVLIESPRMELLPGLDSGTG